MLRCAVLDDYQHVARSFGDWTRLSGKVDLQVHHEHYETEEEVARAVGDCEIVVAMRERTPFRDSLLQRLPRLQLLITTGMRNAAIDVAAAAKRGVVVCGTGHFGSGTSELTWGLILALARHIPAEYSSFRGGGPWQASVGMDLYQRRLGVIGLGRLGSNVARVGLAFGMRVQAWSKNLTAEKCAAAGVDFAPSLDALLESSDVVTVHLILSDRSRGLIGDRELRRMKPSALLINTSRGAIIDEAALVAALREKRIGGAGLDVYDREPLPRDHVLRGLYNVVCTPHIGYVTDETYKRYFTDAIGNIEAWLAGAPERVIPPA
ncbi:MAG TPA: D-2-hydroxyacid dehydrogenase family protein [Burkholderiales bacterium]|nr:D-2-hydroxyacid dehydrogenase family protein [Burkholderiales bacterium]